MDALLQNPSTWVSVAFFIFIFAAAKPVGRAIAAGLDQRTQRIRNELDEAVRLREEAQALLASYQRKQREAEQEAASLVAQAKDEAEAMLKEAEQQLELVLNKRIQQAMLKINHSEELAVKDIQQKIVNMAVDAAAQSMLNHMDTANSNRIIDDAIANIEKAA